MSRLPKSKMSKNSSVSQTLIFLKCLIKFINTKLYFQLADSESRLKTLEYVHC